MVQFLDISQLKMLALGLNFIANLIMPERNDGTPEDEEQAEAEVVDGDVPESPCKNGPSPTNFELIEQQTRKAMENMARLIKKKKEDEEK